MPIIIIVKNNGVSGVTLEDLGVTIAASSQREMTETYDYAELAESDNLYTAIFNDQLILNDGVGDLNKSDALKYLNPTTEYTDTTGEGAGNRTYTGSGVPSPALGIDDDMYTDVTDDEFYIKESGVWVLKGDFSNRKDQEFAIAMAVVFGGR